jgi:hypothetical protein
MHRNADGLGDVEGSQEPHGRIDRQADRRQRRRARTRLQQIVDHHLRLGEIDQEVAQGVADRAGRQAAGESRQGPDQLAVQHLVHREGAAVAALPRIAGRVAGRRLRRARQGAGGLQQKQGQCRGRKESAHQNLRFHGP